MPKRKVPEPDVFLKFSTHHEHDKRHALPKRLLKRRIGTVLFEAASGEPYAPERHRALNELLVSVGSKRMKAEAEFELRAQAKGARVVPGEMVLTQQEKLRLEIGHTRHSAAFMRAYQTRTLPDIKEYFDSGADNIRDRHNLIRRTIKAERQLKGQSGSKAANSLIVGNFGNYHSPLVGELLKEGINVTMDRKPQVYSFNERVTRKLLAGKNPTGLEYKKGMISALWLRRMYREKMIKNDAQFRFWASYSSILIDRLVETQVDGMLAMKSREMVAGIFKANKLPQNPSESTLRRFVRANSKMPKRPGL